MSGLVLAGWRELVRKPAENRRSDRRGRFVICTQMLLQKSRGHFVFLQSASGLAQSKTLRVFQTSSYRARRLGVRRPSAAFSRGVSNGAKVNWNCSENFPLKSKDVYALHDKFVSHWCSER
jgi:hypothetical protein